MEEEKVERLVDQAKQNPIKNVFIIGWEAVILNIPIMLSAILVLVLLGLLGFVPYINVVVTILSATFMVSAQIYIARIFEEASDMYGFASNIEKMTLKELFHTHLMTALGSYFAWVILFLIPLIVTFIIMPQDLSKIDPETIMNIAKNLIPFLIFILIILYVQPLIQYNIIKAEGFSEGFKAVLTLFSSSLWSRALSGSYFSYIAKFGLVVFLLLFLIGLGLGLFAALLGLPIAEVSKEMSQTTQMVIGSINTLFSFIFMIFMSIFIIFAQHLSQSTEVN